MNDKVAGASSSRKGTVAGDSSSRKIATDSNTLLQEREQDAPTTMTPKLRFPEFRDAPGWEEKALGKICEVLNNQRVPITTKDRKSGPYPYYGASGIVDYVDDFIFNERLVLVGEDGAKWGSFEKTAFLVDGKYWVNNHAHVLLQQGPVTHCASRWVVVIWGVARQARIVVPAVAHHITQRGNNRQDVFFTDDDERTYLGHLRARPPRGPPER